MNCFYAAFPICHSNNTANNALNLIFLLVIININKFNRDHSHREARNNMFRDEDAGDC